MSKLVLELSSKEASLLAGCVFHQKIEIARDFSKRIGTHPDLPAAMRKAADELEYLNGLLRELGSFCQREGVSIMWDR